MTPRTIHLATFDTLSDWEIGYATAHIRKPDWQREPGRYQIVTVGPTTAPITTMGGLRVTPERAIADVSPEGSAMLILPGGDGWDGPAMAGFREAARRFLAAGVPVAAICGATYGLALEGLLDDRAHTSNAAAYLAASGYKGGRRYRDELVVIDGPLITASTVAPAHFARAIFEMLELYTPSVLASWFKLHGDRDPVGFAELMSA